MYFDLICINTLKTQYKDDPFILASETKQIFYTNDHKFGGNWKIVQTFQYKHIWDHPKVLDNDDIEHQLNQKIIYSLCMILLWTRQTNDLVELN